MSEDELREAVGLYTRWRKRDELKVTATERFYLRYRLAELNVKLDEGKPSEPGYA